MVGLWSIRPHHHSGVTARYGRCPQDISGNLGFLFPVVHCTHGIASVSLIHSYIRLCLPWVHRVPPMADPGRLKLYRLYDSVRVPGIWDIFEFKNSY